MGNWTLIVQGTGCHHNGDKEFDADVITERVAGLFTEHGHVIESVDLTTGGRQRVLLGSGPVGRENEENRHAHAGVAIDYDDPNRT
jgi:hypothetical protein